VQPRAAAPAPAPASHAPPESARAAGERSTLEVAAELRLRHGSGASGRPAAAGISGKVPRAAEVMVTVQRAADGNDALDAIIPTCELQRRGGRCGALSMTQGAARGGRQSSPSRGPSRNPSPSPRASGCDASGLAAVARNSAMATTWSPGTPHARSTRGPRQTPAAELRLQPPRLLLPHSSLQSSGVGDEDENENEERTQLTAQQVDEAFTKMLHGNSESRKPLDVGLVAGEEPAAFAEAKKLSLTSLGSDSIGTVESATFAMPRLSVEISDREFERKYREQKERWEKEASNNADVFVAPDSFGDDVLAPDRDIMRVRGKLQAVARLEQEFLEAMQATSR